MSETTAPARKGINWGVIIAVLALIGGILGVRNVVLRASTPSGPPAPKAAQTQTVTTHDVGYQVFQHTLGVTGTVFAHDELSIGSEAVGLRIDSVLVEERDTVTKGQPLVLLDDSVLQAQLQQEQARLQGSMASQDKARQPNRPQDISGLQAAMSQAQATVEQQRANLVQAQATLKNDEDNASRYHRLLSQGFVTVADANNVFTQATRDRALVAAAQDQVQAAQHAQQQAESRLQLAQIGGSPQDVQIAAASTAEIQGNIRQLQAQIAQTRILAPDDGLIIKRNAHIGDITAGGKSLFTMVRRGQLELWAQVPEGELPRLHARNVVQVSGNGKSVVGRVWQVSPQVDAVTRLATARITLPLRSGFLPGMFVKGVIDEGSEKVLTVPLTAIQGPASGHFLFVFDNGVARRRAVSIGQASGNNVEIVSGLHPGEHVIVEGAGFLNDGDAVTVAH